MAHKLSVHLDKIAGNTSVKCNKTCKYWRFPHIDTACELSSVFSVSKGMPCYIYEKIGGEEL